MYIVGQTGEVIINSEQVECFYEQAENGVPAIKARTQNVNVTLGLYKTKRQIDSAMADLAMALLADDANRMKVYMMRSEQDLQEIRPMSGEVAADGKQEGTEPAGDTGLDGASGN